MQRTIPIVVVSALLAACGSGQSFEGLGRADDGPGPRVVFDPLRTPFPEIPFPNDVATMEDASSPTGLRLNSPLAAPTQLERNERGLLNELDGFGTFAPITVAFDADLDYLDLLARQNDADASNDGVYVIDLASGERPLLDFNGGHHPLVLSKSDQYFLNDPLKNVNNLFFPDTNVLHPDDPSRRATPDRAADELLTFYERSTRTLIIRPVLPLEQQRRYAVVLTKKLHGADGNPIKSPFSGINHANQTQPLRALDGKLPPGVSMSDVAFAWVFTTQSATRDLELLHAGLNGAGPFNYLFEQYNVYSDELTSVDNPTYATRMTLSPLLDNTPAPAAFLLSSAKLKEVINDPQVLQLVLGNANPAAVQALLDSLQYVDYFVAGIFSSPNLLGDTDRSPFDTTFRLDTGRGIAGTSAARVPFFMAIPKRVGGHFPPFPVAILGHGYKSSRFEGMIGFAGTFAKFGVASVAIDAYGHGLEGGGIDPLTIALAKSVFKAHGLEALGNVVFTGRSRDLDNDGIPESGGDFWTADAFHTRDAIRQSIVDWMQLVRILRTFDGQGLMRVGDTIQLAGDFNNDGIPDLGGLDLFQKDVAFLTNPAQIVYHKGAPNPGVDTFVFGQSLGGILCAVLPAVEPAITAAACGSTAGGLSDVVSRSTEQNVVKAALLEVMGPIVATCNYDAASGGCAASGQPSLVFDVQNVNREAIVPIAPLGQPLKAGDRVTVVNLSEAAAGTACAAQSVPGCKSAAADAAGNVRVSIGADWPTLITRHASQGAGLPDLVDVTVLRPGDSLEVRIQTGGGEQVINTWKTSTSFQDVAYAADSPLTAPARGYGYERNTPEFRRLLGLSQLILGPGDPINFAPHYFKDPLSARSNNPANVLIMETIGDTTVPIAAGLSLARAAGLVDPAKVDPDFGASLDQVLVRSGVVEGIAGLRRYADPTYGPRADPIVGPHIRCDAPDARCGDPILLDPSGFSCDASGANCSDRFGAPRLNPPLREKLQVRTRSGVSALVLEYLSPSGDHSFKNPQPSKPFDADLFFANMVGRYFELRGKEISYDPCQQFTAACPWIAPVPP